MKTILLALIVLATISHCKFFERETRSYLKDIQNKSTTIALSPSQIQSPFLNQTVDFAMGTSEGTLYFSSLSPNYPLVAFRNVTENGIRNLTWNHMGLHVATPHEIIVLDFTKPSYTELLYLKVPGLIKNAVFENIKNTSILTAISYSDKIQVYKNTELIASVPISVPCFSMAFSEEGDEFYFIASNSTEHTEDIFYQRTLDIESGNITDEVFNTHTEQSSLNVIGEGNNKMIISSEYSKLWKLDGGNFYSSAFSQSFNKIKSKKNSNFVLGFNEFAGKSRVDQFRMIPVKNGVISKNLQTLTMEYPIGDLDMRGNIIVSLADEDCVGIYLGDGEEDETKKDYTWIIWVVVGVAVVAAAWYFIRRQQKKRKAMKIQQGSYITQEDIASPYGKQNQGFSENVKPSYY